MSPQTQVALLRVLETKTIRPLGASKSKKIHCKIIAATNANIVEMVKDGRFRSDLYYRLKSLEIKLKSLRERREDIIELALYFLNKGREGSESCRIDKAGQLKLMHHAWPGNTRELQNEMHKTRMLHSNKLIYSAEDFKFLENIESQEVEVTNSLVGEDPDSLMKNADQGLGGLVINAKSAHRRIQRLKELFVVHKQLRRIEIINTLKIAQTTATKDLKQLIDENFITKIMPTSSARTHYFELVE